MQSHTKLIFIFLNFFFGGGYSNSHYFAGTDQKPLGT